MPSLSPGVSHRRRAVPSLREIVYAWLWNVQPIAPEDTSARFVSEERDGQNMLTMELLPVPVSPKTRMLGMGGVAVGKAVEVVPDAGGSLGRGDAFWSSLAILFGMRRCRGAGLGGLRRESV